MHKRLRHYIISVKTAPTEVETNNLKSLVSQSKNYVSGDLVAHQINIFNMTANSGKVAFDTGKSFVNNNFIQETDFSYSSRVNFTKDDRVWLRNSQSLR